MQDSILITGGAGFIGSNLAEAFLARNHQVTIVDDLSMGKRSNLPDSHPLLTFIEADVCDSQRMRDLASGTHFDYIYHLAAVASVADSVARPQETHQVNFGSVMNLLNLVRETQPALKRFVFSSSAAVYGDEPTLPKQETSAIKPLTPYAIDKFAAERLTCAFYSLYGIPTSTVRFFNVFGPKQNPASPYSGVLSILVENYRHLLRNKPSLFTLFGDGTQSRDFVFIADVIQALKIVATSDDALGNVYNVGNGIQTTLNEVIKTMDELLGVELPLAHKNSRAGDIHDSYASISVLKQLGYAPQFQFRLGISNYLQTEGLLQ